jgi:hypothetical protein
MIGRSIGISLVDSIWFKRKRHLNVILPVLVAQAGFLLSDAEDVGIERRNLVRILFLIEKCLPYDVESFEVGEILNSLLCAAISPSKIDLEKTSLRMWYKKFNKGSVEIFDAETSES